MAMREECKHFQSRTYKSGEVARFCVIGQAPDQPWSCPENCLTYERRYVDIGWSHGTLVDKPVESPPSDVPLDDRRELLESASDIVNAIAPKLIDERRRQLDAEEKKNRRGWKFWRR